MDKYKALEVLTSIVDQVPMLGHEEATVFGAINDLASDVGNKDTAAQRIAHLIMSIPLTRPVRQQAKTAIECLKARDKKKRNAKQ
jgi:hypothetical protein